MASTAMTSCRADLDVISLRAARERTFCQAAARTETTTASSSTFLSGGGADGNDDRFIFDGTAFDGVDTITDFIKGEDRLYLDDVLAPFYDPLTDVLSDFVQLSDDGTDTTLLVDRDGTGGAYTAEAIAIVEGVVWTNFAEMVDNGDLHV